MPIYSQATCSQPFPEPSLGWVFLALCHSHPVLNSCCPHSALTDTVGLLLLPSPGPLTLVWAPPNLHRPSHTHMHTHTHLPQCLPAEAWRQRRWKEATAAAPQHRRFPTPEATYWPGTKQPRRTNITPLIPYPLSGRTGATGLFCLKRWLLVAAPSSSGRSQTL